MSSSKIPPNESSSQFLLSELHDSSSSSDEEDEVESKNSNASKPSKELMIASGENVKNAAKQKPEDYERKTIIKIMEIKGIAEQLEQQISDFNRDQLQEQSKKIEEILIQHTLALDNTDTRNLESVKELRKNTIVYIQDCLKLLDSKLNK
ncbi:hypothetical protein NQ318_004867 [Aromia moschata]|uniref:BAG domain-containing protein n=1 Tax=Aromia moschata TaxID=1265417 RepID=A0AAV8Z0P6_9CUCU|nr:hypothetical protein NQ318_004867 [Aromia moschata]